MGGRRGRPKLARRGRRSIQAWGCITPDLYEHCQAYARERRRSFSSLVEEGLILATSYTGGNERVSKRRAYPSHNFYA
jgi:hypothetical protein